MSTVEAWIEVVPGQTRMAVTDGGRLVELIIARPDVERTAGNVYLGRVERFLPDIQAVFVDIGLRRSGFLALADARPPDQAGPAERIAGIPNEGDTILVQSLSDPVAGKGAKLTTRIALPGRFVILTPGQAEIRFSRRLSAGDERRRLAAELERLREPGEGMVVRTSAVGAGASDLARDVAHLRSLWRQIADDRSRARPPTCLHADLDPVGWLIRERAGMPISRIVVDDAETLADARSRCRAMAPELAATLVLHTSTEPLFEVHGIEDQIADALAPQVPLPGGGNVVIAETAALTAIDVNTGGQTRGDPEETALAVDLEATEAIAHQMRLRNLAGLLVIDFVPLRRRENGESVLAALRAAVAEDSCPVHVAGFTRLGLVELTRERRHGSLAAALTSGCPMCADGRLPSAETAAYGVIRGLLREERARPGAALTVRVAPAVAAALEGPAEAALAWVRRKTGAPVSVMNNGTLAPRGWGIFGGGGKGPRDGLTRTPQN